MKITTVHFCYMSCESKYVPVPAKSLVLTIYHQSWAIIYKGNFPPPNVLCIYITSKKKCCVCTNVWFKHNYLYWVWVTCNTWTFEITNLVHNYFNLQQYICYTTLLKMFRAARCSSSGGPTVSPQPLVSSPSVSSRTVHRWRADWVRSPPAYCTAAYRGDDTRGGGDTVGPPDDEQRAARNMLRSVV